MRLLKYAGPALMTAALMAIPVVAQADQQTDKAEIEARRDAEDAKRKAEREAEDARIKAERKAEDAQREAREAERKAEQAEREARQEARQAAGTAEKTAEKSDGPVENALEKTGSVAGGAVDTAGEATGKGVRAAGTGLRKAGGAVKDVFDGKEKPEPEVTTSQEYDTRQTVDATRSAQTRLRELGYYDAEVDGVMGEQTEAALRKYQMEKGLEVTGRLDQATAQSLGLEQQPPENR